MAITVDEIVEPSVSWNRLLIQAITEPGKLSEAYSAFHRYSLGNCWAAYCQCLEREIEVGPISTFKGWKDKGRSVKKGESAILLCMPIEIPIKKKDPATGKEEIVGKRTAFTWKKNWFILGQTEGEEYTPETFTLNEWDKKLALETLGIKETAFESFDGNCQGYAYKNEIAISPIAHLPHKVLFTLIAHILLKNTEDTRVNDMAEYGDAQEELEAACVTYILLEVLGLEGSEYVRGYIQERYDDNIRENTARKIFSKAEQIMKAGYKKKEK